MLAHDDDLPDSGPAGIVRLSRPVGYGIALPIPLNVCQARLARPGSASANQAIDTKWVFGGHGSVDDPATMKRELAAFATELTAVIAEAGRLHEAQAEIDDKLPKPD